METWSFVVIHNYEIKLMPMRYCKVFLKEDKNIKLRIQSYEIISSEISK